MASVVSYEQAMATMADMFQEIDREIIHMILQNHRGNMELAIEELLAISNENKAAEKQINLHKQRTSENNTQAVPFDLIALHDAMPNVDPQNMTDEQRQLAMDEALARALQDELFLEQLRQDETFTRTLAAETEAQNADPQARRTEQRNRVYVNREQPPTTGQVLSDAGSAFAQQLSYMGEASRSLLLDMRNRFLASSTNPDSPRRGRYVVVPVTHASSDDDETNNTIGTTPAAETLRKRGSQHLQRVHPPRDDSSPNGDGGDGGGRRGSGSGDRRGRGGSAGSNSYNPDDDATNPNSIEMEDRPHFNKTD